MNKLYLLVMTLPKLCCNSNITETSQLPSYFIIQWLLMCGKHGIDGIIYKLWPRLLAKLLLNIGLCQLIPRINSIVYKTAAQQQLALDSLTKQTGSPLYCLHRRYCTATAHRLGTYNSFLCVAKPSKWIVLLHLTHILFIVILNNAHLMIYYKDQAEGHQMNMSGHIML